jgi:hypothetical protein
MPFKGAHFYNNDFQIGSPVGLDGRVIGRVEDVVPQVDAVHVVQVVANVDVPIRRLVALPGSGLWRPHPRT